MLASGVLHDPQGKPFQASAVAKKPLLTSGLDSFQFWNVKLTSKLPTTPTASTYASTASSFVDVEAVDEEKTETPDSLRAKQARMERQVEQIWRVLSAFEESSAGCISEMLRFVSAGQYLDAVIMAERFILHVEVLFAAIDDLEAQFAAENVRGKSCDKHDHNARLLIRLLWRAS
jgi:hypothetical protein